ncbi:MAG: hypothetical protein ABFR62_09550 [Bacteroidota bacterium]
MKKLLIPIIAVLFLLFSSCDEIDELTEIEVDVDLETSEMIISPPVAKKSTNDEVGYDYYVTDYIIVDDIEELEGYSEQIESIVIDNVEVKIISVSEDNTFTRAGTYIRIGTSGLIAKDVLDEDVELTVDYTFQLSDEFKTKLEENINTVDLFYDLNFELGGTLSNDATVTCIIIIKSKFNIDLN